MCGIAGFSLNPASKINARALAHALLSSIESRGAMSSGVAYPLPGGGIGVYKDAVAGSNLPLKAVPRNAKTLIAHTRYATKGSPTVNENNHPVWSPEGTIALVHNGVIWNDMSLRFGSLRELDEKMPEVDTACIPALLESKGLQGIKELAGDAAVAWLDASDPHELHLARIESSPVAYTNLFDGSFVFASTPTLLNNALAALNIEHGQVFNLMELDYYRLRNGVIWNYSAVPEPAGYGYGLASSTRGATSGGHSVSRTGSKYYGGGTQSKTWGHVPTTPTTPKVTTVFGTPEDKGDIASTADVNVDSIAATDDEALSIMEARAMALLEAEVDRVASEEAKTTAPDQRTIVSMPFVHPDLVDENGEGWKPAPQFFTIDTDGNLETYDTLEELEKELLYTAGRSDDVSFGTGMVKWVNHFSDIGSYGLTGEQMISWLEDPEDMTFLEGEDVSYIKDGVSLLAGMAGR